jgi:hypothetical protein
MNVIKTNNMQEHKGNCQTNIRYRKIYLKALKNMVKIIKMFLKVYPDQWRLFISILYKVTYGIV